MTPTEFRDSFGGSRGPFASTPDPVITLRLAIAEARTPTDIWGEGDVRLAGVLYLAAHLIALEPGARDMRKGERAGETVYGRERATLEGIVASGYRTAGPSWTFRPPWGCEWL